MRADQQTGCERKSSPMKLREIIKALKNGVHPQTLGEPWTGGAQRTSVVFVGNYVVKNLAPAGLDDTRSVYTIPVKPLRRLGIEPPRQWRAGRWIVQPFYRPFTSVERAAWEWTNAIEVWWQPTPTSEPILLDVAPDNLGVSATGRVVAFDW